MYNREYLWLHPRLCATGTRNPIVTHLAWQPLLTPNFSQVLSDSLQLSRVNILESQSPLRSIPSFAAFNASRLQITCLQLSFFSSLWPLKPSIFSSEPSSFVLLSTAWTNIQVPACRINNATLLLSATDYPEFDVLVITSHHKRHLRLRRSSFPVLSEPYVPVTSFVRLPPPLASRDHRFHQTWPPIV